MTIRNYRCRVCDKKINDYFCDLGPTPLANSFIDNKKLFNKEKNYPLKVYFCKKCYLPQLPEHVFAKNIFSNYDYFSSYSKSWIKHSKNYVSEIIKDLDLNKENNICEIGSNDGYLLQFFKQKGFKVLGVEPAKNVANKAVKNMYHFVFDNGAYCVTGGQPVPGAGIVDWKAMGDAAGYAATFSFENLEDLVTGIDEVFAAEGPVFIRLAVDKEIENTPVQFRERPRRTMKDAIIELPKALS